MRILGIDPGSRVTGWGLVDAAGWDLQCIAHGAIRLRADALADRLHELSEALDGVISLQRPDVVAVESVFTAKNSRSALVLGHARGISLLAAARAGLCVHEYAPARVKSAICGNGRAEKDQVQRALATQLGMSSLPRPLDASDALAVATCHAAQSRVHHVLRTNEPGHAPRIALAFRRGRRS